MIIKKAIMFFAVASMLLFVAVQVASKNHHNTSTQPINKSHIKTTTTLH